MTETVLDDAGDVVLVGIRGELNGGSWGIAVTVVSDVKRATSGLQRHNEERMEEKRREGEVEEKGEVLERAME